jgi:hypothetical protein
MKVFWLILAACVGLGFLCCGGGTAFLYFGMHEIARQVRSELDDNPVLVEHVGEIQEFEIDFAASFGEDGDDVFVYNVTGTKGSGVVTAEHVTIDADTEEVVWARLTLPTGETVDLVSADDQEP